MFEHSKFSGFFVIDTNAQCAICMEDFGLNEKAKKLPCKHLFHEPCITEWLKLVNLFQILIDI